MHSHNCVGSVYYFFHLDCRLYKRWTMCLQLLPCAKVMPKYLQYSRCSLDWWCHWKPRSEARIFDWYFEFGQCLSWNNRGDGLLTYITAHHKGVIKITWLHFGRAPSCPSVLYSVCVGQLCIRPRVSVWLFLPNNAKSFPCPCQDEELVGNAFGVNGPLWTGKQYSQSRAF